MDESGRERHKFAKSLRNNATPAERGLWFRLRKEALGFKFSRQVPIGCRIADFCCRSRRVVVEIDGASHKAKLEDDEVRDAAMIEMGYVVLRFTNEEAIDGIEQTLETIRHACEARPYSGISAPDDSRTPIFQSGAKRPILYFPGPPLPFRGDREG